MAIHHITAEEWIDNFESYSTMTDVQLKPGTDAETDRQVNQNAIVLTGTGIVKGVRLIECLDFVRYSPLGAASKRPPDGFDKDDGNAIIFTQRIVHNYESKLNLGEGRALSYFTFENGAWTNQWEGQGSPTIDEENDILKKALAFYAAHEALGHSLDLTPTQEGTKRNPVGFHHVSGTGTNIDIKIVHKVDKKTAGFNKFYIPMRFGISDKRDMRLFETQ